MGTNSIAMTPRLAEVLAELCDEDEIRMDLESLEELQDFVLSAMVPGKEAATLGWLTFLRNLRSVFVRMAAALKEEGGES